MRFNQPMGHPFQLETERLLLEASGGEQLAAPYERVGWPSLVRICAGARAVALAFPALAILTTLTRVFYGRLTYPRDVEWLEGSLLYQAFRLSHGLSVYGPPKSGACPLLYPPLYFLGVAGLGRVFGIDYVVGRSLSIAGFVLFCVSAGWSIVRDSSPRFRGSVSLFSCSYRLRSPLPFRPRVDGTTLSESTLLHSVSWVAL